MARGCFVLALCLAAALRFVGLGWGIPRYDEGLAAGTRLRTSYHVDEDKILWQLDAMRPSALDLRPRDFSWGSLHTYLVGAFLTAAGRTPLLPSGWRLAFENGAPPEFATVFLVGRAVSAVFGTLVVGLVYLIAAGRAGAWAGSMAALLMAVAPLHVVDSHFLTPDVALSFWTCLTCLLVERRAFVTGAFVSGLAVATKPSAAVLAALLLFLPGRLRFRVDWRIAVAAVAGFLLGEPYAMLAPRDWILAWLRLSRADSVMEVGGALRVWADQFFYLAGYGVGPVALGLGLLGLRRSGAFLRAANAALFLSLGLTRHPMARYALPLIPLLTVSAALHLVMMRRRLAILFGAMAFAVPMALSAAQVGILRAPHSADQASRWIDSHLPVGARIARVWPDYPVLDGRRYRLTLLQDPFGLQGRPHPPLGADLVVLDDLPVVPLRPELREDLERHYALVASFRRQPRLFGHEFREPAPPHDWKYTHPEMRLYQRRERLLAGPPQSLGVNR
jgi:Dolichyl-phosphate-mannose-protein mannosyltransferase